MIFSLCKWLHRLFNLKLNAILAQNEKRLTAEFENISSELEGDPEVLITKSSQERELTGIWLKQHIVG